MGKRTREQTEEEIERKIKRLQKELQSRRSPINHQIDDRDYGSFHASSYEFQEELELDAYAASGVGSEEEPMPDFTVEPVRTDDVHAQRAPTPDDLIRVITDSQDIQDPSTSNRVKSVVIEVPCPTAVQADEDAVPEEILEILGEAKKSEETFGKKIPQGVSERLGKILVEGLAKEQKQVLLTNTLIPENFQLAIAPKLNAEVASVLNEPAKNRDKRLERLQNQLGSGIAGLTNLTSDLIQKDFNKMDIIKKVSEVNQILLDLHHEETLSRRRLIIPMLDKNFINIIQSVKRDKFLFGDNLGDNIKTSKAIEKSSLQIKKPALPQPSTSRKPAGQQGNSRVQARQPSGPDTARAQPATARYNPPPPPPAGRRPPPPPPTRRAPPPGRAQDRRSRR